MLNIKEYKTIKQVMEDTGFSRVYIYILTRKRYFEKRYITNDKGTFVPMLRQLKKTTPRNTPPHIDGYVSQVWAKETGMNIEGLEKIKIGRYIYFKLI
jgi:hypothetical protein